MKPESRYSSCNEATLHRHGVVKSVRLFLVWFVAVLLVLRWNDVSIANLSLNENSMKDKVQLTVDQHTLPTLLSVVDATTGQYLNALTNNLYQNLNSITFEPFQSTSVFAPPELSLDNNQIKPRDPLTLRWTLGMDQEGQVIVQDEDVLVLRCRDSFDDNWKLLDAATILQAKATHQKHVGWPDHHNLWYFPNFPVLRHNFCSFSLCRRKESGDDARPIYTVLAEAPRLDILDAQATPSAIHMAFGSQIDEMVIQFKTGAEGTPVVKYGHSSYDHMASGTSHTYTANDMCQAPANEEGPGKFLPPGQLHVIALKDLEPDTTYWYRVAIQQKGEMDGDSTVTVWSDTFSFVSAPMVKADADPWVFLTYGDQGCPARGWGYGGFWISAMAARELDNGKLPVRAVHHFGDLSYGVGVGHIWDEWLNMISSFTARVPLMVGVGNHEYDHTDGGIGKDPSGVATADGYHPSWGNFHKDSGGECGVPTANHFIMPKSKGSNGVFWWSHDLANVHTIMLSSEHDLSPGSIQHQWVKQDLESVNRSNTPWIVLELHRPLYESERAKWDYKVGVALRVALEDLLLKHQVDLVLAGHYHTYFRTCQGLHNSKCNNGGPLHITVGSAGASLTNNSLFPNDWTAKYIKGTYGYGRITVSNSTAMHFEFVQAGSEDDPNAGRILDDVWLRKPSKRSEVPISVAN